MWLFLGALVVVGVLASAISGASSQNKEIHEKAEKARLIEMRAKAYADYLKRTKNCPDIIDMTEDEISEYVFVAIRTFNKQNDDLTKGAGVLALIAVFIGIAMIAADAPPTPILLLSVFGLGALWNYYKKEAAKIAAAYVAKGFEIERLKIED